MKRAEFLAEIKDLKAADLNERARVLAEEAMKLRFRKATRQLEKSHRVTIARKERARVKTLAQAQIDSQAKFEGDGK